MGTVLMMDCLIVFCTFVVAIVFIIFVISQGECIPRA